MIILFPYYQSILVSLHIANRIPTWINYKYYIEFVVEVRVSGRVHAIRPSGAKLIFYDLRGEGTKVQIMANASRYDGSESVFSEDTGKLRRGDVVGVVGHPGK